MGRIDAQERTFSVMVARPFLRTAHIPRIASRKTKRE
jgi:hypothetical protein